ncbi:N-acetylgalactosamine 6-sulfate sulfatase [Puteibacter caeruleilacunae]|nr:N-acetylgalactosamine 6-sulfate sulfatase [Puteibacter caeruleilacunae]
MVFSAEKTKAKKKRPNIILCMADDLGWGDPAYNGNKIIKTPNLDAMANNGIRFDRFYSSSPVCSPTRGSCITGRHPYRYGIFGANVGHMKDQEITLAEILKDQGYVTGHFGKWHLGTLTTTEKDANRGGEKGKEHFSPPQLNGFDVCFSTESKVPTYDPMITPIGWGKNTQADKPSGTYYWNEKGEKVTDNLEGDDSRIIMDRAIPFIENAVENDEPFFTIIWFHAPHLPVLAGEKHRSMYEGYTNEEKNYYGCITALDDQMGRLRAKLKELGIEDETMLWFTSDNGPEGAKLTTNRPGSAGPFKGRKRSLHEGGVRVPGILVWPQEVKKSVVTDIPCSTLDYFPTILDALGYQIKGKPSPIDGHSLLPLIHGKMKARNLPIGFESKKQIAMNDDRYKLYSSDMGQTFELYDMVNDKEEQHDIASSKPEIVKELAKKLAAWRESCQHSLNGADY